MPCWLEEMHVQIREEEEMHIQIREEEEEVEQEEEAVKGDKGKEEQGEVEKVVHIQMFVVGLVCQSVQV